MQMRLAGVIGVSHQAQYNVLNARLRGVLAGGTKEDVDALVPCGRRFIAACLNLTMLGIADS
jgi:hypothetical protein